jgi:tetratricopeptide (TPR) repeat protein
MTREEVDSVYRNICENLATNRIQPALTGISALIRLTTKSDFYYRLEDSGESYKTLLKYTFEGYEDPDRSKILDGLIARLYLLADDLRADIISRDLLFHRHHRSMLRASLGMDPKEAFIKHMIASPDHIFRAIWLSERIPGDYSDSILDFFHSRDVARHDKSLIVSALTLSSCHLFDPVKIEILIDAVLTREDQVYQRALTGLILLLIVYDERLRFFPEIPDRIKTLGEEDDLKSETELIIMQFINAQDTDRITREFEEQILPEMQKMMPKIEDKLHLRGHEEDEDPEEKNPGWKDMIEEVPGLLEKIEKFSRMQMEGGDVFMSTFRQLKRFAFFNSISNWFVPFYRDHPELGSHLAGEDSTTIRLFENLEKAFYICNSDKYSFVLNFNQIPEQQRTMIVANFEAEFAQMREMASEEQMLDQSLTRNSVYVQYIQDLYRFFKLFPSKAEFEDIFQIPVRISTLHFYSNSFMRPGFLEKVAAYHFEKGNHTLAAQYFQDLISLRGPEGEYYEKIGYSYQKSGDLNKAIEAYTTAELFDGDHLWVLKKLGWCFMKINNFRMALNYFLKAQEQLPDDIQLQLQAGQCYLQLKEYENAVHQYQKARFFAPENLKVLRPLSYALFLAGKTEQAEDHSSAILDIQSAPSPYDLMNAAHIKLCGGKTKEALKLYLQCFQPGEIKFSVLLDAFDEDVPNLIRHGVSADIIPLLRDFIILNSQI